jgi:hypothetical protein
MIFGLTKENKPKSKKLSVKFVLLKAHSYQAAREGLPAWIKKKNNGWAYFKKSFNYFKY